MKNSYAFLAAATIIVATTAACSSNGSDGATSSASREEIAAMTGGISAERLVDHVKYLASDELEGRAPGSRGEELTLNYLSDQYNRLGLRPGNPNGLYIQEVPLISTTVTNSPPLRLKSRSGRFELPYLDDFMGWTLRQQDRVEVRDAELVFVGYGIVAPEYEWDDYKGKDLRGKVLVMLVGDPPLDDAALFGGRAMTYYGRWTYKFEIAADMGAAGAIIVHNTQAAGYPWEVVSNSWSGTQFDIVRASGGADRCVFEGWVTERSAERIVREAGLRLAELYRQALSRDFEPIPLGLTADVVIENSLDEIRSYNAVAMLEGNDPELKDELVVYTAHWDHLGIGNPVDGDSIYNGALDNASGVAATLELARALAANRKYLRRSVLIINTTAEESGLIGAKHYAENPLYPLSKTVALINIDGLNVWGKTRDVAVVGYGFSDLDDYLREAVRSHSRSLKPDAEPEKGYYYRSDHFPFAKKGVPGLYADSGVEYVERPEQWGLQRKQEYTSERYHKPQDEYDERWNLAGAVEDIEAFFRVGLMIAASAEYPHWSEKSEFREIREASLNASR